MIEKYIFINKNNKILRFEFDIELNVITKIDKVYNLE